MDANTGLLHAQRVDGLDCAARGLLPVFSCTIVGGLVVSGLVVLSLVRSSGAGQGHWSAPRSEDYDASFRYFLDESEPPEPVALFSDFPEISSDSLYTFPSVVEGVIYMARFVCSRADIGYGVRRFWSPLRNESRVRRIFDANDGLLETFEPTDVTIVVIISLFYDIALHGIPVHGSTKLMYSLQYQSVIVVTAPKDEDGYVMLADAWSNLPGTMLYGITIDLALDVRCMKSYNASRIFSGESIRYDCQAQLFNLEDHPDSWPATAENPDAPALESSAVANSR